MKIPFNKPFLTGSEIFYINQSLQSGKLSGNYHFANKVKSWINSKYGLEGIYLTPSCTAALEMGALLVDLQPGDEVIMPSYTFTSTANSVLIFGAKPVFCDIHSKDMNIDVQKIESLITSKTKMIIPIDYAGVPCDIDEIMLIAEKYGITVMQDCAQSYGALYKGEISGKRAHLSCYSFHDTKNLTCGEGGALIVNEEFRRERASYLMEKGTDRTKMLKGLQKKYSWIDKGSSYLLSDILAAMLLSQLENEEYIISNRLHLMKTYYNWFNDFKFRDRLNTCKVDSIKKPNGHSFWLLLPTNNLRDKFIQKMKASGVTVHIGYIPLHSSKMGRKLGYQGSDLQLTEELAGRIARMPIFTEMSDTEINYTIEKAEAVLSELLD
ncbi:dTDP-4-amino-4,6-dideoxygalactose transaminase [Christiangramia gaetbulicola]|uniref:dTDP-4-amino-4,6-dideoxygalactose transaminase n=1 Tax=Christiangramia gaetbulicola TaxID=703340 RepID=A0A2T6AFN4_9FLAO|nr:dTDP-4-amino-4,6-dideoxygalactose transaminase [Christiangramia gaetbulicola]PTX42599.1 dTDP-4-amino-4,6-dideoxygalactose transaminase [Christiangramia gaetbulicola]